MEAGDLAAAGRMPPELYQRHVVEQIAEDTNHPRTTEYSLFVQDDWKLTPDFKLLYGVRYDYYAYPDGIPGSPYSEAFPRDGNNFAPRAGFAWTLGADRKTVVRGSSGLNYDQPLLAIIEATPPPLAERLLTELLARLVERAAGEDERADRREQAQKRRGRHLSPACEPSRREDGCGARPVGRTGPADRRAVALEP